MAEIIGIASGVAGLLSLTIEVIQISSTYINSVRGASSTVQRFLKELENLKSVLSNIDEMTKNTDDIQVFGDDGHSCLLSLQEGKHYLELLVDVRNRLDARATDGSFRKRLKALTWPLSEEKTLSLIESLHRHLDIYQTALAIENLAVGKLTLSEVRQVRIDQQDSQVEAVLDWLSPLNMYQKQQDILSRRHGDTGAWLLSNEAFQRWVNSESSDRTLWCPGDPGTGKTVITSIVVDHLVNAHVSDEIRIAYLYCDYKDQVMQTASNLIACLARQLVGWPKRLPLQLERLHKELEPQRRRPSLEELRNLLVTLCNERRRTFVVVDALDECEALQQRRHFLPLLKSLPHGSTRLFVTSRPNNEDICHIFTMAPQIQIAAPEHEIKRFVKEKMKERDEFTDRVTPVLKDEIISTISARASGMFLLAVLQIDRICVARTVKKIKSALTSMPRELNDLYGETVERIRRQSGEDGELGMRILSWVTHTKRPLHVEELAHGLAVEYDDDEGARNELDTDNLLSSRSLVDVCAGLVVIDPRSQIIRLVHYTTQEYFDKERLQLFENAEVEISRASLTYLSYDIANIAPSDETISDAILSHPFLTYASLFWFLHIKENGENARLRPVMQESLKYVNDPAKMMFSAVVLRKLLLRPRTYARVFEDIHRNRRGNLIALEAASECGLLQLVKFLLDHSVGSESALDSAMSYASAEGHTEVVTLLIERGASVQSLTGDSSNALQKACKGGHLGVAKILLQHGANANTYDRWMWTPLHHAAHGSHCGLVAMLVRRDASPNSQTPLGLTACHLAASRGDAETITLLLDANYDLGLTTRDKHTPLHKAAEERHLDVCRLLLQRGSDVQAKNRDGQTALDLVKDSTSPEVRGIFAPYIYAARGPEGLPPLPEASFTQDPTVGQETSDDVFRDRASEKQSSKKSGSKTKPEEVTERSSGKSSVGPAATGVIEATIGPAIVIEISRSEETQEEPRERRHRESELEDKEDAFSKSEQDMSVWQEAASIKRSSSHESYGAFFTPLEILNNRSGQEKTTSVDANADADIHLEQIPQVITVKPEQIHDLSDSPAFSLADTDDKIDVSKMSFPWQTPRLRLVEPTPPSTRGSTPSPKVKWVDYDEFIEPPSVDPQGKLPVQIQ